MRCILLCLAGLWMAGPCLEAAQTPSDEALEVRGLLVPHSQARLASRAKGVIAVIGREGDRVKAGDPVMELESDLESMQLEQQKEILTLRAFERAASDELNQKSVISKTEVEEKRVNHEVAKVQLRMAEHFLETRKVTAPFDGVIAERLRERGEAVDEFTPVVLLAKLDELYLEVFLPGERFRTIKVGDAVEVMAEDQPGKTFAGAVAEVSPTVNPASGEFRVRILVPNPDEELVAGASASVLFRRAP
jgi:membrane fusion protein (multidrug efflux system)